MDLLNWILKYGGGGGQDSNLEPYDQVVKVAEGWVDLEPGLLAICGVAKSVNILLDKTTAACLCRKSLNILSSSTTLRQNKLERFIKNFYRGVGEF